MSQGPDRRTFLRRAAVAAFGVPALGTLGCGDRSGEDRRDEAVPDVPARVTPRLAERPILLPWGPDAVRIAAPPLERPVAYVSRGRMEVYVDLEFRDRLAFVLSAHISVSTGRWRIPLPGDSPTIPVQPGDARREFEELDMRVWDASLEPSEGDMRVLRGSRRPVTLSATCEPLSGGGAFLSGGPWEVRRSGLPNDDLTREDLMEIGTGTRFADRDCTRAIGEARFVTWACRDLPTFSAL
jgi:hypothetical protein